MIIEKRFKCSCVLNQLDKYGKLQVYFDNEDELNQFKNTLDSISPSLYEKTTYTSEKNQRVYVKLKLPQDNKIEDFLHMRKEIYIDIYSYIYEGTPGVGLKLFKII